MITLGEGLHYDVPMETYHGNCCPGPSVSGSVLWDLHSSCPAKAVARHYLKPDDDDEEKTTEAKAFGTAANTYIIEGVETFEERYAVKPAGMNFSKKDGIAWRDSHSEFEIITAAAYEKILGMSEGLQKNEATANAFTGGKPEVTAIIKDRETGLYLKARPDYLRPGLALNYKTTKSLGGEDFMRDAWKYGYCVSAAICTDVLKLLGEPAPYCIVAQEKTKPFLAKAYVLSDDYIIGGRMIYRRALRKFADCLSSGKWEGYGDEVGTLAYPPWAERILADIQSPV